MNWTLWLIKVLLAALNGAGAGLSGAIVSGNGLDSPEGIVSAGVGALMLGGITAISNWSKNRVK